MNTIQGVQIDFDYNIHKKCEPRPIVFSVTKTALIDFEIERLIQRQIIKPAVHTEGEFISTIFLRVKKDGGVRLILILKRLNKSIEYHKFKMDPLKSAICLMEKNCWFASVDLKDAYYSLPVHTDHQQSLRFRWRGTLYQFTCMPNGLTSAPRIFTKTMKVVFSLLRKRYLRLNSIFQAATNEKYPE